ncbi:MFS transporter [Psychrobacter jeotgali]|uniref:MFS transporter n=1 Tax=Psychrobacter jeotgali TaxID=179010 RepID=UPI001918FD10|nr:MFS transporter [Psychrobacter jeotgali]
MPSRPQYAMMSPKDRNMLLFVCFTSAVAFFDFLIYLYMADSISSAFFPVDIDSRVNRLRGLGLFAIGYLARPIGGIVLGRYGDIKGRKPVLLLSILITAFSMLAMAFLPSYLQWGLAAPILFILLRMIQGMAFGVYVPLAWTFISEHLPRQYLTLGCSYVTASFFVGVLFSNTFFVWLNSAMTPEQLIDYGWRVPFVVGAVLSFLPLIVWRFIRESPFFIFMQQSKPNTQLNKPLSLLFKHCKHAIFIGLILAFIIASITTVIALLLPSLVELSFSVDSDLFGFSHSLGIIFMIFGCIFYGFLSNYKNFGKILVIGSLLLIAQMFAFYYHLRAGGDYILIMYALLGFFAGIVGMVPAIFVVLFPINVRLTGIALSYNTMYAIVGGVLPFALAYLTVFISFSPALYIAFIGLMGVMIGLYFYHLPEFREVDEIV